MANQDLVVVQSTCKYKTPLKHSKVDSHVASTNTLRIPKHMFEPVKKQTHPFQPLGFANVTVFH